jgi:hypothetical protein
MMRSYGHYSESLLLPFDFKISNKRCSVKFCIEPSINFNNRIIDQFDSCCVPFLRENDNIIIGFEGEFKDNGVSLDKDFKIKIFSYVDIYVF